MTLDEKAVEMAKAYGSVPVRIARWGCSRKAAPHACANCG